MLVEPILCYAYIFGQVRVFLSKPVNQVQFNKTIIFLRLSRLQAYFQDIRHVFHTIKHFFIPKSTKSKSFSKICKTIFGRTNFVLFGVTRIFLVNCAFFFPNRLIRFGITKNRIFIDFQDF